MSNLATGPKIYILTLECSHDFGHFPHVFEKPTGDTWKCRDCMDECDLEKPPEVKILKIREVGSFLPVG